MNRLYFILSFIWCLSLTGGSAGPIGFPESANLKTTGSPAGLVPVSDGVGSVTLSTAGTGTVSTAAPVGATPNAAGMTVSGANINLQPANSSFPGAVTTGTQTFAGAKTFSTGPDFTTGNVTKGGQSFIRSVGTNNFAAGQGAGQVDAGSGNSMLGVNAGNVNSSGSNHLLAGVNAALSNTTGTGLTCLGANSCQQNVSGNFVVAVGSTAGYNNLASDNTFVGTSAGFSNTTGTPNAYYARNSGRLNTTGSNNSCFGPSSCFNANASNITAMGANAGVLTTANNGTFIGTNAGSTATTGANLIMIGNNVQPTTATTADETRVGTSLFANLSLTSLRVNGATVLSVDSTSNVFTNASKFNIDANGNITKLNNVTTSWPAVQGAVSTFLQNNGSGTLSWSSSPVTTMAAVGAVPNANGASISGANLTLQPASLTLPGVMTAVGQAFGGAKEFGTSITVGGTGAANFEFQVKGGAGNSTMQQTNTASGDTATDGVLYDFDGANLSINNQEGQTFFTASSFGFTGSELNLTDGNFLTTASTDITLGYTFNNSTIGVSSSVQQIATTGALELQNNGGAGINFIAPSVRIAGGRTESTFQRSCTLTSAASATPINCLDTLDIGTGQVAYISGFRAKVNGATAWTGVTTCTIEDTAAVSHVDILVANLTANAYINDSTAGVVLNDPFALGLGGTADNGIEIVCNSNGTTGSDLVVTIYGVIK